MVRRTHIVAAALVVAVVAGGTSAYAQRGWPGGPGLRGPGGFGMAPRAALALRGLDLTEAQQQQVRQLGQQYREQARALNERLRDAAAAQRQAAGTIPVDEGRIRAAMQELAQAQTDLAIRQARLHSDIYAVLTPEQQQRAEKLRAEREARQQQRRQRAGGPAPGVAR